MINQESAKPVVADLKKQKKVNFKVESPFTNIEWYAL